ncbi:hypothetical protein QN239_32625 [Mycolicibacterium sp. Y3]
MTDPASGGTTTTARQSGLACVVRDGIRWRAHCTCGELPERSRILKAAAIQDAQGHAASAGCDLSWPLVLAHHGL